MATDIIALLDTAIEELRKSKSTEILESGRDDSAETLESGRDENRYGHSKTARNRQKSSILAVVAAVAVRNEGIADSTSHSSRIERAHPSRKIAPKDPFESEKSGVTATFDDSCGQNSGRSRIIERTLTATFEDSCGSQNGRSSRPVSRIPAGSNLVGLSSLDPHQPFGDTPPKRWSQLIADAEDFVASGWAAQAEALGWTVA
jgi:hypothetical protein